MTLLIVAIISLGFAVLAWKNFEQAVLVLMATLPLYLVRFSFLNVPFTLLEAMILIAFVILIIKQKDFFKTRPPFSLELILWLLVALAACALTHFSMSSLGIWRAYFFEPVLAFIIFVNAFTTSANSKRSLIKVGLALAASAIIVSLFAAYQYLTGHFIPNPSWVPLATRRATSFFPYPNAVGLYLAPIVTFSACIFAAIVARRKKVKSVTSTYELWLVATAIILSLAAILFARSEGAIFAISTVSLIGLLVAVKKSRLVALALVIIFVVALIAVPKAKTYVVDRLTLNNFSGQVRKLQWHETWKMLKDGRLISGAGLAHYQTVIKPYHQDGFFYNKEKLPQNEFVRQVWNNPQFRATHWQPLEIYLYPHNIALNFWSELGLLGLVVFAWLIIRYFYFGISTYRSARKNNDPFAWVILGLMLAMLTIIIHGIVDVPYFKNDLAVQFWLLMAMMATAQIVSLPKPEHTHS